MRRTIRVASYAFWIIKYTEHFVMNQALWPFIGKFVIGYFNNILIYSANFKLHLQRIWEMVCVSSVGIKLYAAVKNYVFMTPDVLFLGYVVSRDGLQVDGSKVEVVRQCPRPRTILEFRSFYGLVVFLMWTSLYSLWNPID